MSRASIAASSRNVCRAQWTLLTANSVSSTSKFVAPRPRYTTQTERERWHAMLMHVAMERGYKPGWAAHKYKEKFGTWPPWGSSPRPISPLPEVRSWVRSRYIAHAKRRGAA